MSPRDRGGAAGCQDMTNALVVLTQHFLHLLLYEWHQLSYIEMSGIDKYACDIDRTHFLHRHSQRQWHKWISRLLLAGPCFKFRSQFKILHNLKLILVVTSVIETTEEKAVCGFVCVLNCVGLCDPDNGWMLNILHIWVRFDVTHLHIDTYVQ